MIKHKAKNTAKNDKKHIAVIGAGWAGCAAAVTLCQQGHQVTLIEASRTLGGRARAVEVDGRLVDNGQHILLGAYSACLELMRLLRIDLKEALLRLPLQMVYPHQTGIQFIAPKLPAPLHVLFALMSAKGLSGADKMALARFSELNGNFAKLGLLLILAAKSFIVFQKWSSNFLKRVPVVLIGILPTEFKSIGKVV